LWDWGWTWKHITISNSRVGFKLTSEDGASRKTGSVIIQDTLFYNTQDAVVIVPPNERLASGSTGVVLDNVVFKQVNNAVLDTRGKVWLPGAVGTVDTWVIGSSYENNERKFLKGVHSTTSRPPSLVAQQQDGFPKPMYFEHVRPQYEDLDVSKFVSVKSMGAKGKFNRYLLIYLLTITEGMVKRTILQLSKRF
jgi:hypothetical protein